MATSRGEVTRVRVSTHADAGDENQVAGGVSPDPSPDRPSQRHAGSGASGMWGWGLRHVDRRDADTGPCDHGQ